MDSLGHAWQGIVIRDATCETDGKLLELCSRCGQMKQTATPKGEHSYEVYTVAATCTGEGVMEYRCIRCGYHCLDADPADGHIPGASAT